MKNLSCMMLKTHCITLTLFLCLLLGALSLTTAAHDAGEWHPSSWPVLRHYDAAHLYRIALPLGGIGTGTVSLGGRGELRDWEIMNVPAKGYSTVTTGNNAPFFALRTASADGAVHTTLIEGPLNDAEYLHYEGRPVNHHGLPRFSHASFDAAYPFGQVQLSDSSLPVEVTVMGFNPLVPADADASGLPIAVLTYRVKNVSSAPLTVSVAGSMRNFIGRDGSSFVTDWKGDNIPTGARANRNEYRDENSLRGLYFYSRGVDSTSQAWGTMALVTGAPANEVSYSTASVADDWSNALLHFWDDFSGDGRLTNVGQPSDDDPMGSLSVTKTIAAGGEENFTFYLTWSFPNRKAWSPTVVGNYYCIRYPDAWLAARDIVPRIPALEEQTLAFVNAFVSSSLPNVVKEAALFNLSALRSQTVFRLPDGQLMGWEGVMDRKGSCEGSCTHVWNYETATASLFGDLALTMRDVELNYATRPNGLMNFRAALPLSEAARGSSAAADGQMGCVMKAYREWQLSGSQDFLRKNWPQIKSILSYAWVSGGWDANRDGLMEGAQHNTMDVAYYGPNPQMGFWYLGALRAAAEMAQAMHDTSFERECRRLFASGSRALDEQLFNGDYYEQKITDPATHQYINMEADSLIPPYQLGRGCLVDQLVGQYMAHLCALGYLGDSSHIRRASASVMRYNFVPDFSRHFNNMRSYVMGHEAGLLMASWPKGRLTVPFPYFAESMTGFEYTAAVEMWYDGLEQEALRCVQAVRDRFDGARRNPFDEPECGHHYARSMASWSLVPALSGFHYSGVHHTMQFTSRPGRYFWSNGYNWGLCEVTSSQVVLTLLHGTLQLQSLWLEGRKRPVGRSINLGEGDKVVFAY